jgi:hypothetical protein
MAKGKITANSIALAVADGMKQVETFVSELPAAQVLPFLAKAVPVKQAFDRGVKLAEARAATEKIIERGQEWTDKDTGEVYVWDGALGDAELGDPAGCYAELQMLDVDTKELDATFYKVWKTDFNNLKRIEAAAVRLSKSGNDVEKTRGARIVDTIKNYKSRKPDGPPHLKGKE